MDGLIKHAQLLKHTLDTDEVLKVPLRAYVRRRDMNNIISGVRRAGHEIIVFETGGGMKIQRAMVKTEY